MKKKRMRDPTHKKVKEENQKSNLKRLIILIICLVLAISIVVLYLTKEYKKTEEVFGRMPEDQKEAPPQGFERGDFEESMNACGDSSEGDSCEVTFGEETASGTCTTSKEGNLICMPEPPEN